MTIRDCPRRLTVVSGLIVLAIGIAMAGPLRGTEAGRIRVAGAQGGGTAIVRIVTVPPGTPASFQFIGVPSGAASAGQILEAGGLEPGSYTSTESGSAPQFTLVAITCDDQGSGRPSVGDAILRTATFNVEAGETVTCIFTLAAAPTSSNSSAGNGSDPAGSGTNPFENPDEAFDEFPLPDEDDVPASAGTFQVPRAGPWDVTNFPGTMACTGVVNLSLPLAPSTESGLLDVLDGGQTVVGTGFGEDTAPITFHPVAGLTGRYAGSVGGSEGGIPMTIDFFLQLITDEWIVGYLTSRVDSQGMTCNMFRTFELEYAG